MIFPHVHLNFTDQKTISSSFYHPTRVMSSDSLYDLSSSSWYSTRIKMQLVLHPTRVAINNHSKSFPIIWNDLRLIKMNSSHSKTAITLLTLRPLYIFPHSDWIRRDTPYLSVFCTNVEKYGPEQLRIRSLFTQWMFTIKIYHSSFMYLQAHYSTSQWCLTVFVLFFNRLHSAILLADNSIE